MASLHLEAGSWRMRVAANGACAASVSMAFDLMGHLLKLTKRRNQNISGADISRVLPRHMMSKQKPRRRAETTFRAP